MPQPDPALSEGLRGLALAVTLLFGLGFVSGVLRRILPRRWVGSEEPARNLATTASLLFALLGSAGAAGAASWFLLAHCPPAQNTCQPIEATLWQSAAAPGPVPFAASLYVDRLAAFLALLIAGLSFGVTIYSVGWLAGDEQRNRVAGFYNLFVLGLLYVVLANHVFFLILVLEVATLAFGYLILYQHNRRPEEERHHRAFATYLVISQLGTALILAAFLLLASQAQAQYCPAPLSGCSQDIFSFDMFRPDAEGARRVNLSDKPGLATLIFLLAFGGLSIRAGAFPLHFWVSLAHPSSPTTTHAMSLGIGIKVALYLMLRMFFEFLYPAQEWWGWIILLIGGATAVYNVFFAALAHDLKRALAYHSVENIGIILAGMGLALAATAAGEAASRLAALGLIAALYHLLNHTVFKSLLYLCTGIVEKRTGGVVRVSQLGGVWRYYPWTASAFVVGAAAISGLPPFNGFVSEWLTLTGLFGGLGVTGAGEVQVLGFAAIITGIVCLALAFSLTALAFVKMAGQSMLGAPRDPAVWGQAQKGDAPVYMLGVVGVLAVLCLTLGLAMQPAVRFFNAIAHDLSGLRSTGSAPDALISSLPSVPLLPILLAVFASLSLSLLRYRAMRTRRGRVWVTGAPFEPARMQSTGAAFTYLLWSRFSHREQPDGLPASHRQPPDTMYARLEISAQDRLDGVFRRLVNVFIFRVSTISERLGQRMQNGNIRWYLMYILAALVISLFLLYLGG